MESMMSAAVTRIGKQGIVLPSRLSSLRKNARFSIVISQVRVEDMVEITQNKVLVAAAVSKTKRFTRVFLSDKKEKKDFDPWAAIESGGFPSSHSSAVTPILLETPFSDYR